MVSLRNLGKCKQESYTIYFFNSFLRGIDKASREALYSQINGSFM